MAPNSPTSCFRLLSRRTTRIALLLGFVAAAALVLSSTNSFAGSLSQRLIAGAAALISGGKTASETNATATNHALHSEAEEAPAAESSAMLVERRGHTATRLSDGRVLIAGGENGSGTQNQSEIYDPAAGTFSAAASMDSARADHSATLLADGRVLIVGGRNGGTALATTEIFDPATGVFTNGPSMSVARAGHSATLFANGRVLVAGGNADGNAEIFDPVASTFTSASTMTVARSMHSAALLQDGRVLLVGGRDEAGHELDSGEIFDTPVATFAVTGNELRVTRVRPHLRVLFDGKVQVIGGNNDGSMEVYDPVIAGFGAYAHVLPESDPCAGLSGQILISQTRAALFHNGQADAMLDRSGHTITELNGFALVLGGANSSGAVLNLSALLASSAAMITTDKMDYAPGEVAHISGRGFQPGEVVRLKIHEDPHTPQERGLDVTADAEGNFSGDYLVMEYDLDMKFIVGARGLSSGATAQTTFTDANPQSITVAAPTSVTVLQGATANYGSQTLTVGGNTNPCTVTFNVASGLPVGATPVWGTNPVTTTGANVVTSFSVTTTAATAPGTYTFQVRGTNGGGGCQGAGPTASNTLTLIVNAATVNTTTTVANAIATYGDASVTLNATVTPTSGPAVNNGSVTFTVKQGLTTIGVATTDNTIVAGAASVSYALPAGTDAGPYTIEASYTPGAGFNTSNGTGSLTINKRAIEVTADAGQFKTYGDADPASYTYSITSGSLVAPDAFTGALSRVAGENAGLYAITIGTLAINDGNGGNNYNLSFVSNNFEIKKRAATWTTNAASKTYGDADPVPLTTGSGSNFVAADNVTASYSRVAGENASPPTYHITATLSATPLAALDNYIITNDGAEFTINKRLATWNTNAASKTYGDPDPVPLTTGSGSNFVAADNVTASYSRVAGENASPPTYHITATLSATPLAALDNYIITNDGAEFTINKRLATWTTNPNSKTYGDADPVPLTTGSGSNFVAADNVTATYSRVAGENASPPTYHITATLSATPLAALDNYIITNDGAEFTINKRLATWNTNAASKTYGDADPVPLTTGSGSNFVATDNVTATYSRAAGVNASPPTYHITATLSATPLAALDNYIITNDGAEFTINKRLATWTTNAASKTYGDPDPVPLTTGSGSNFVAADNVTASYSRVAGENASPPTYHITATLSATPLAALDNYIITNDGAEFTINKRLATWTTNAASKTYGDADPVPLTTGSGSNFVAADNVTASYSRVAGENASPPTYHITATLSATPLTALDNYIITNDGAEFTINKRLATWTTNPNSKTYGDADPVPLTTGSGSNFVAADNVTATYSRVAGENASPPTYHITATLSATPLAALDNYIITNDGAEFTINKRLLQVTATAGQFKIYGNADPTFAYTITSGSLAFSDSFTGALSRAAGENVGMYAITIGTLSVNDGNSGNNYTLTLVSNNFEIKKRAITVKADAKTKTFGDPDPAFTYQITVGSLAFTNTFTGALTRDPGELVGIYAIKIGTLAINDGNSGNNYTLTFVGDNLTILTACSVFNGFLSPIGGAVELGNGGSFADPVRAFKLNSTIPVKFNAICLGTPLTTGIHTLQAIKYSNATTSDPAIDATPTDAATTGNEFRLTGTEWHFNLSTKGLGNNGQGIWLLRATLFDGSAYSVWVSVKK